MRGADEVVAERVAEIWRFGGGHRGGEGGGHVGQEAGEVGGGVLGGGGGKGREGGV